jgi:DNA polymerase-1
LQPGEPDTNGLYELFSELEFKSLLKKIPAPSLQVKIQVQDGLPQDFKEKCKADGLVFYTQSQIAYVFNDKVTYKAPLKDIQDLLNDGSVRKISFDFKAQMLYENLELNNMWFDVKIAAYLVDPSLADYEFAAVVSRYLAQRTDQIPAEGYPYFIKQLYDGFIFALEEGGLAKLFFDVEMPLVNVLYGMEKNGIHIDGAIMAKLLSDIDDELNHTQAKVYQIAGKEFNLNSPKQLQDILFNVMKIKPVRKTKTGYSTDEEVLKVLSKEQIIAAELLKYREANKLKTTYLVPLIEMIKSDGMLHAQFNQTAAATGRLSSSSPNLQSIPAKGRFSAGLRKAFIPSFDNGFIVAADYSQIELRILAHFSQDEKLAQAFRENIDIHAFTASLLFGLAQKDIGEEQRDLAKKINFAVLYGMGAYSLSQELEISVGQAETFIQDYFLRYPKVKEYIDNVLTEAERNGYVRTILGRKRNLLDLGSKQIQMREFARRQAVNTPIQGSCADLIKLAMVNIDREFSDKKLRSKLIIQIHDELVFDVTADEKDKVVEIIKRRMETALTLSVPLKVNVLLGNNWGEMVAVN